MGRLFLCLAVLLSCLSTSLYAVEGTAKEEIDYLLQYIEKSNAHFIRNNKEYSAKEGADHMRQKLAKAGSRVKTAEDFINGVATKSYLSGEPYTVKTDDGKVQPTGPWLTQALARHRSAKQ